MRDQSPQYYVHQARSNYRSNNYSNSQRDSSNDRDKQSYRQEQNSSTKVFDEAAYYAKFGKPPKPCGNCQFMHWSRHCLDRLDSLN